jgi:hypothetical protein
LFADLTQVETRLVVVNQEHVQKAAEVGMCSTCELDLQQTLYYCTQCARVVCEWCQEDHSKDRHNLLLVRDR